MSKLPDTPDTPTTETAKEPTYKYAHALVHKGTVVLVRHIFSEDGKASVDGLISELIERKSADI